MLIATERRWVEVRGSVVVGAGERAPPGSPDVEWDGLLAPGLVDLQVNGAAGHEVTGGDAALDRIEAALLRAGVTGYLAALVTRTDEESAAAVASLAERVRDPASPLLGVHAEGPFLSRDHAGMHRAELLRSPDARMPSWLESPAVRMVTLAPELAGAAELVRALAAQGVAVSLGHTGATAAQARAALDAGARLVTHAFNAMAPARAREPGVLGVALTDARVDVMVIADGVHVDAAMLQALRRCAGERVLLVSDAAPAAAAPAGEYGFAGTTVVGDGTGTVRDGAGRLAGSGVLLDLCVRGWAAATGATLDEALAAASDRPRAALGQPPGLVPGSPADLVLLGRDGTVARVMRAGEWVV